MLSNTRVGRIPRVWVVATLGAIAGLPATAAVNWLPNSEATVGGGVMIVGAMIAGAVAATRSVEPSAAGLRAGFLGGMIAVSVFIYTDSATVTWSLNTSVFFLIAVVTILCISPVVGLISGRIGGWVANTVADSRANQGS